MSYDEEAEGSKSMKAEITCFSFSGHSYYNAVRCATYTVMGAVDGQPFWYMAGINSDGNLQDINRIKGANGIYREPIRKGIEAIVEERRGKLIIGASLDQEPQ